MKYNDKDLRKAVLRLRILIEVSKMTIELFDVTIADDHDNKVFEPWDNIATDIYLYNGGIIEIPSMNPLDEHMFEDAQNEATALIVDEYNKVYGTSNEPTEYVGSPSQAPFRDPGGRSALRAGIRRHPCPTCHTPNALTDADVKLGYQCDRCADAEEGYF